MFIEETNMEKRQFRRQAFREAVRFESKELAEQRGCLSCDLSENGLKVNTDSFVPLNAKMLLQLRLDPIERIIDLTGRVAWLQQIPYSERYYIGVEFLGTDPIIKEEIRRHINSRIA